MQTVRIQTAQNVFIEYQPASIGERILASIIDNVVRFAYVFGCAILATSLKVDHWIPYAILAIPFFFYHLICEIFLDGKSVGKIAMNTKVVKLDGSQPSISSYLLRWLLRVLDTSFMGIVGIISIASGKESQRLGDRAAGTTVIKTRRKVRFAEVLLPETQEAYEPVFPQVAILSDQDVAIIKEVLQAFRKNRSTDTWLLHSVTDRIKSITGIQSDMSNLEFLQTVLKDHAHLTGQ